MAIFAVFILLLFLIPGGLLALVTWHIILPADRSHHTKQTQVLTVRLEREDRLDPRQLAREDQEHRHQIETDKLQLEREKQEADIFLAKIDTALKWWFRDIGTSGTIVPQGIGYQTIYPIRAQAPEQPPAPTIEAPQTFRQLLQAGTLSTALDRGQMLLGYTSNSMRYGSWLDLYSCAIGGVPGSGKTTTVRFLLFQGILAGAQLIMVDPHIHEPEESLAAQFRIFQGCHLLEPCDDTPALVLKRVRYLVEELKARKARGQKTPATILVIDEFNAVMRVPQVRDEMAELLVSIAQEGRKFGLFAMLLGQRWSQDDIGGADIRTSLASTLAHRFTDEGQAGKLIGGRNKARCLELPVGHYLFRDTNGGLSEMVTPLTTADDGKLVARLIAGFNPVSPSPDSGFGGPSTALQSIPTAEFSEGPTKKEQAASDARSVQVRAMILEGFTPPQIVRELWGVKGGDAYQKAMAELSQIIARLVV